MTQLQQNRYDQLLRRVGDLKGPGSKVNDALAELFPMFDVENVPGELLLLSGSRLCMGTIALTAGGVGFFNQAFLRVAGGSSVVARLIEVHAQSSTTTTMVFGPTQNSSVDNGVEAFADGRVFGQGTVARVQGDNNFLGAGSTFLRRRVLSTTGTTIFDPAGLAIITPGTAFSVSNTAEDLKLDVSFRWIERVAQPSELNL